jgi:hypothetical protein
VNPFPVLTTCVVPCASVPHRCHLGPPIGTSFLCLCRPLHTAVRPPPPRSCRGRAASLRMHTCRQTTYAHALSTTGPPPPIFHHRGLDPPIPPHSLLQHKAVKHPLTIFFLRELLSTSKLPNPPPPWFDHPRAPVTSCPQWIVSEHQCPPLR